MNAEKIIFHTPKGEYAIPNRWELLTQEQYLYLVALLTEYGFQKASEHDVKLYFACKTLGVNPKKIKDSEATANLIVLAEQVDFIFNSSGRVNACFIKQMIPKLELGRRKYHGYEINTSFDTLTCSLTAAQFIEAQEVLNSDTNKLPLLAAILYCQAPYSSYNAHELASKFINANPIHLQAIALNFQAFITFLFTRTHFSLLASGKKETLPEIATGLSETLYNLSADGMGDINAVKQMPVIEFLSILRKKLIESVRAMHDAQMDIVEISDKTGLSIKTIKKMI